jgi:hypothetical protein
MTITTMLLAITNTFFLIVLLVLHIRKTAKAALPEYAEKQSENPPEATQSNELEKYRITDEEKGDICLWDTKGIICFPQGNPETRFLCRKDWLLSFLGFSYYYFRHAGYRLPPNIAIRPKFYGNDNADRIHVGAYAEYGTNEIVLNEAYTEPLTMCATILHELCHIVLFQGIEPGKQPTHDDDFRKMAKAIGLVVVNKDTGETKESEKLRKFLSEYIPAFLGEYPNE